MQPVTHPELPKPVDPLVYLAGMGLLERGKPKNSFFKPDSEFVLTISYPPNKKEQMEKVLTLIQAFGAVGGRSRNGLGSFQFISEIFDKSIAAKTFSAIIMSDWKGCMKKDYPNGLGESQKGLLLWKTKGYHKSWEGTMTSLAETYIAVRAGNAHDVKLDPLDPGGVKGSPKAGERHLLGVPLTHHPISNDKSERYASPLRFIIKKRSEGYMGFVLHVPHAFSLKLPSSINQIEVWEKVHNKLDALMERAKYEESL
jgi:CRISPR-associated protein Cmr1